MTAEKRNSAPREVEVPHPSYQPTAKELSEDLRLKGTFEDGGQGVTTSSQGA